jgi:hypothetical protein
VQLTGRDHGRRPRLRVEQRELAEVVADPERASPAPGENLRLAAQDHVEEVGRLTRSDDHLAGRVFGEAAELDELAQPAPAEAGEEREVPEDVSPAARVVDARDALQPNQP